MKIRIGDRIRCAKYHPDLTDRVGDNFTVEAIGSFEVFFSDGTYLSIALVESLLGEGTYEIISSCPEESSSCLVTIQLNRHIDDVIRELRAMRIVWPNARVRNSDLGLVVEK